MTLINDIFNGKYCVSGNTYIVEYKGDLPRHLGFDKVRYNTFLDALKGAEKWAPSPDPEDDRILIWEVLPSGHKKVVWHFSGWHWIPDEFGDQGRYWDHKKSLYEECMDDY